MKFKKFIIYLLTILITLELIPSNVNSSVEKMLAKGYKRSRTPTCK